MTLLPPDGPSDDPSDGPSDDPSDNPNVDGSDGSGGSEYLIDSDGEPEGLVFPVCRMPEASGVLESSAGPQVILFAAEDPPQPVRLPGVSKPRNAGFCVAGPRQSQGIHSAPWCPRSRPFVGAFFEDGTVCCVDGDRLRDPAALRALVRNGGLRRSRARASFSTRRQSLVTLLSSRMCRSVTKLLPAFAPAFSTRKQPS